MAIILSKNDERIDEVKKKIEDVKKRWPFHSPKPSMFKELEDLELELAELQKNKQKGSGAR
ncbi:MAG: histidine kinase [Firmicutes bacterium]|nr:histidine kinase [Bacillota bacterium]